RIGLARCLSRDSTEGDTNALAALSPVFEALAAPDLSPEIRLEAYSLRAQIRGHQAQLDEAIGDMAIALAQVDCLRPHRCGGGRWRAALLARHLPLFDRMMEWQVARGDVAGAFATHERARARVLLDQIAAAGIDLGRGIPGPEMKALRATE